MVSQTRRDEQPNDGRGRQMTRRTAGLGRVTCGVAAAQHLHIDPLPNPGRGLISGPADGHAARG
jgi:hypothetical protein